jgi:hypothetical protein
VSLSPEICRTDLKGSINGIYCGLLVAYKEENIHRTSAFDLDLFYIWEIYERNVCCCLPTFNFDSWKYD